MALEVNFWKKRGDRKFLMTDNQQRDSTGLSSTEFEDLAGYLEPFASRFRIFDYKESLNILLIHIR